MAEASVLGAIFLHPAAAWVVAQTLRPEHFHGPAHRVVFTAMLRLIDASKPLDATLVEADLIANGELATVGGRAGLLDLVEAAPTAANVEYYAGIVRAKAALRELAAIGRGIVSDAYDGSAPPEVVADRAEQRLVDALCGRTGSKAQKFGELLMAENDRLDGPEAPVGLETKLVDLDRIMGGLRPGDLPLLAARPSVGKSALAATIIRGVAMSGSTPTLLFTLETGATQVMQNMIAQISGLNTVTMARGARAPADRALFDAASSTFYGSPIWMDETRTLTVMGLRAKARMAAMRDRIRFVVVDYLQLLEGGRRRGDDSRAIEVGTISRGLKQLAGELKVPVLALSQLNRAVESRSGHMPQLSDLRESGSLEQDADVVMLLHREKDDPEKQKVATLFVAKNRNGPTGRVSLAFDPGTTRFASLSRDRWDGRDWA